MKEFTPKETKTVQPAIRIYDTHVYIDNNLYKLAAVNVTPMTNFIEYILQKEVKE